MNEDSGQDTGVEGSASSPYWPGGPYDFDAFEREIGGDNDRAAALVAVGFLEWRVRESIKARLFVWDAPKTPRRKDFNPKMGSTVFGGEGGGRLGFVEQCRVAYCLGLLGRATFCDCEKIARIRNRFAHNPGVRSFDEDPEVMKLCDGLETPEILKKRVEDGLIPIGAFRKARLPVGRRERFVFAAHHIQAEMWLLVITKPVQWPQIDVEKHSW